MLNELEDLIGKATEVVTSIHLNRRRKKTKIIHVYTNSSQSDPKISQRTDS